jgi:hypothetical protein
MADGEGTIDRLKKLAQTAAASSRQRKQGEIDKLIDEFNAKYFVVNEGGNVVIYEPRDDPLLKRTVFRRISFEDFNKLYLNRRIWRKGGSTSAATIWLRHRRRRQFIGGIVFDPAGQVNDPDVYNLWQGFAVQPLPGSWTKLREHARLIVCGGQQKLFDYLLDLLADMIQHPEKQGEVAAVMRGPEGCGKGILVRALLRLLGQHGLHIASAHHLIGNFNAHMRDCILLYVDEALFAGDKRHIAAFKAYVTEPTIPIEGKHQNIVVVPNLLHIILTSNEDWVIPADLRSRRWFMLDVLPDKIGDFGYFQAIYNELNNGGYEAMLYELLHRDLSKANLRAIPVTEALIEQRKRSLDTTTEWWFDCLHRGFVHQSKFGLAVFDEWHSWMATELLYGSYLAYCQRHHERRPLIRELFGRWLCEVGARVARKRNQIVGEVMTQYSGPEVKRAPRRTYGYTLGGLKAARGAFKEFSGLDIDWGKA